MHWALQYIGRRWESGAQGPDSWDCWQFFRWVSRHHYGLELPQILVDADNHKSVIRAFLRSGERSNWAKVRVPQDGDAVLMSQSKYPSHIGIWLDVDGGAALHCVRGAGVVFSDLTSLKLSGWSKVEFYRHASHCTNSIEPI